MKYTLRSVWYILRVVLIAAVAFAVLSAAFFIAMDSANVFVIVTDGMKARATNAFLPTQATELRSFFTDGFLGSQPPPDVSRYAEFSVTGIEYKLTVESLWCDPWRRTATVTAVESIPEFYYDEPMTMEEGKESPKPPAWQRARYRIRCVRVSDAWRIDSMELIKALAPEPTPTPEPSQYITASPLPTSTPHPSATTVAGTAGPASPAPTE